MRNFLKFYPYIFLILFTVLVYKAWFFPGLIAGGDFQFYYSFSKIYPPFLYAWGDGLTPLLGSFSAPLLWGGSIPNLITDFIGSHGLSWQIIERLILLYPYLIFSTIISLYSFGKVFSEKLQIVTATIIFLFNTFILMWIGGGLILVGISYSFVPLIFFTFREVLEREVKKKDLLFLGLILGIQAVFDVRISFITFSILFLYFLYHSFLKKEYKYFLRKILLLFIIPGVIVVLLNFFWILPTIISGQAPSQYLNETYTNKDAVTFFSFGSFANAISLLSPYWPENVFGKISFLKPEFLLIPILAFSSLLFLEKKIKGESLYIFAVFLSLVGIFLTKGVSSPLGETYLFLNQNLPGFNLFREPTKWFVLIAFGYSILIPFAVSEMGYRLKSLKKFNFFVSIIFIFYLAFLLRPLLLGQGTKLFNKNEVPQSYLEFKDFTETQNSFFRIGWFPVPYQFGYASDIHPAIQVNKLFNIFDNARFATILEKNQKLIEESSIKYIVVPEDSNASLFTQDWRYDDRKYQEALGYIKSISWLKEVRTFGKIAVFGVPYYKDHFWTASKDLKINYTRIDPSKYELQLLRAKKGDRVIFSEAYDKNWIGTISDGTKITSSEVERFNSFIIPRNGNLSLTVHYSLQEFVNIGEVISLISLIGVVILFLNFKINRLSARKKKE